MQALVSNSRRFLAIAVVGIASVAAYVNTLGHGFVYDDAMQILQNPWIKDVSHLREIFTKSVWGFHSGGASNYYRPFMNLIFMVDYHLFGLHAWGFHLVSILFHTANSLLVLLLVERLLPSKTTGVSVSFVAALLFAVHPIHSEVVAWACGITDASFTFFLLLSWVLYLASRQTVGTWAYLASLVAFFFSLLCKEPAVVLPGLLLASDYAFGSADEKLSRRLIRYAPFLVVVGAYLVLRFNALGGFFAALPQRESGLWASLLNGMVLFTRYLGKLLLPTGLSAYHALMPVKSLAEPRAMAAVIVVLAYGGFCLWSFRKNRALFVALALTALPLLPVLHVPSLGSSALAERYLYLPSVGFVLLLSLSIAWLREHLPRGRAIAGILVLAVAGGYLSMTVSRNAVWRNNFTLYSDMARKYPAEEFTLNNYAEILWESGRRDEAIGIYRTIVSEVNPSSDSAHYNLGSSLQTVRRLDEALEAYQKSLALEPNSYFAHYAYFNLGTISFNLNRFDDAIKYLKTAVRIRPGDWSYHALLGNAFGRRGLYDAAIRELESAVRIAPGEAALRASLEKARVLKAKNAR